MKKIFTILLLSAISISTFAQNRGDGMRERIKSQKVAFITEKLNLSTEEAQLFWPIYNAYDEKTHLMKRRDLKEVREAMRKNEISESEAQKLLDKFMQVEDQLHLAKKELVSELKNVLPAQKIIGLKSAEDAFNRRVMEMLRERRQKNKKK